MYINFQQVRISRSVETCSQIYLQIFVSCINLQLPIVYFFKNDYFKHASSYNVDVY